MKFTNEPNWTFEGQDLQPERQNGAQSRREYQV